MKSADTDRSGESAPDPARVEQAFNAAMEQPVSQRAAFLESATGRDDRLRSAVQALLVAGNAGVTIWDGTALDLEARHTAYSYRSARPGEFFGPYRIQRRIAAGGMSIVYEARRDDAEFDKRVAIKFVQHGADDAAELARFRGERQILAGLEHPYIARLLDGGTTDDGIPYLIMEYVDGLPIDRYCAERQLPRAERLRLFLQVCEAVDYAHRNLVVHRDLKPANILVTGDGVPKLLDFGIAKLLTGESSAATVQAMTPEYASPEQIQGHSVSTASDVYSLGVLLFALLADRLPYGSAATQKADLVRAICEEEPVWKPAGLIRGDLHSILAQALRKEPQRRYLSVEQFAADIRRYVQGLPVVARPDSAAYRARKFVLRRPIPVAAVCAALVAALAGTWSTLAQSRRADRRFNEVRGLAHSVLFDIYDSLGPGSVSTRRMVVVRAQQYLDTLALEAAGDATLTRELAESYLRLGDVQGRPYAANLGDTAGALDSYRKGQKLFEREAARDPSDAGIQERLCEARMDVGRILSREKNAEGAIETLHAAIAGAQRLAARYPSNLVYVEQLSRAHMYLGVAEIIAADRVHSIAAYQTVLATYRDALGIQQRAGEHPEEFWQRSLASKYFYISYAFWKLGEATGDTSQFREALANQLTGVEIRRNLAVRYPAHDYRRDIADSLSNIGWSRWKGNGDLAGAMRDFQDALATVQAIANADTQNVEARRDVADVYLNIGRTVAEAGRGGEALTAYRKAATIYEEAGRADPSSQENADNLVMIRARIEALVRGGSAPRRGER